MFLIHSGSLAKILNLLFRVVYLLPPTQFGEIKSVWLDEVSMLKMHFRCAWGVCPAVQSNSSESICGLSLGAGKV